MSLLKILYRDDDLVAIDKPDGVLVHRTRLARDHVFVMPLLRDQIGRLVYPVHRLDRATSGVMIFALRPDMAAALVDSFTARRVTKQYLAVVRGHIEPAGRVDHPLRELDGEVAREAATRYERLAIAEIPVAVGTYPCARCSLVVAQPETGRGHQIRRHLKHLAHPVIGDTQHGDGRYNRLFRERFGLYRLLLHAWRVSFPHPRTGTVLNVDAPLPDEMRRLFDALGWIIPPSWPPVPPGPTGGG